ncbi:MAG: hypothetical protein GF330_04070 [Candidatus Eisenbacteria bacterium]|nr:hypothetical protein [Candidatus Eisenbacteria bacterium]
MQAMRSRQPLARAMRRRMRASRVVRKALRAPLRMLTLVAALLAAVWIAGCSSDDRTPFQPPSTYVDLDPIEAFALTENRTDLYIIDVSDAYISGFIPRAVNYSYAGGVFEIVAPRLNSERPYLIYAHDDEISRVAAQQLLDLGFVEVYRLDGSFAAWVSAGLPVTHPSG